MRDDIVEAAVEPIGRVANVEHLMADVGEAGGLRPGAAAIDRQGCDIEVDELGARKGGRQRDRIESVPAADQQGTRRFDRGRGDAMQPRDHRQMIRPALAEDHRRIREGVVGGFCHVF